LDAFHTFSLLSEPDLPDVGIQLKKVYLVYGNIIDRKKPAGFNLPYRLNKRHEQIRRMYTCSKPG
jgi:hypothetical protein